MNKSINFASCDFNREYKENTDTINLIQQIKHHPKIKAFIVLSTAAGISPEEIKYSVTKIVLTTIQGCN